MTRLTAGDSAPDFTLRDDKGEQISLSDFRGKKVILYVYPEAMTSGCTTQACDFRDSLESLANAGYTVVGLSPDDPDKLAEFRTSENLSFPLLSDPAKTAIEAYGAWGEKTSYGKQVIGVIRSTFVIDAEGKVEKAMYNVQAKGHVARLRAELVH